MSLRFPLFSVAPVVIVALAGAAQPAAAPAPDPGANAPTAPATAPPPTLFREAAAASGLDFVHVTGATGALYFPEIAGAGGALIDYDRDGDLDVFLVQGGVLGAAAGTTQPGDRLYRNDLAVRPDGSRELRFTDVTAAAGFGGESDYGMGAAVGDYDGDGWDDLYVTNFGPNRLWRNRGDGSFEDVTAAAGAGDVRWSVPALFFDADGDGRLDLYVGNYVDFVVPKNVPCLGNTGVRDYCGPLSYQPEPDRLLHNLGPVAGEGGAPTVRFADLSARAGLDTVFGAALGAVAADFDDDGRVDLYVANDGSANQLWRNLGLGEETPVHFADEALLRGAALNADGKPEAGMGVAVGDYDADGDEDLLITHLDRETNTLYVNDGGGLFSDRSVASGLGMPSWSYTGFGTSWIDYDNDGWLDLLVVNGAVFAIPSLRDARDPWPYHQTNLLFRNLGAAGPRAGAVRGMWFADVSADAGPAFALSETSRAALFGDLDDDGDTDVVVTQAGGPVRLLVNEVGGANGWIGFELLAAGTPQMPRTEIGARLDVLAADGTVLAVRHVHRDGSYAAASDPRVLVGLGDRREPVGLRVRWPDGQIETWRGLAPLRYYHLRRGEGVATPVSRPSATTP